MLKFVATLAIIITQLSERIGVLRLNWPEFKGEAYQKNFDWALGRQADGTWIGGMKSAEIVVLKVGTRLCRIGNSARPARTNISGAWWVYEEVFASILRTTTAEEGELLELFRDKLALANDFKISNEKANEDRIKYGDEPLQARKDFATITPWDRVFTMEVTTNLLAFSGVGRDVTDSISENPLGTVRSWKAAADIKQLFVPGLLNRDNNGLSEIGKKALHFRRSHRLRDWREWMTT